jgi:bifunctional DNase/RNase
VQSSATAAPSHCTLPAAEREAIFLVYQNGLSQKETAVSLGISLGAVKVRVHRGRRRLYQTLVADQEVNMIEVVVKDMVQVFTKPDEADAVKAHSVMLLQEANGERLLPIWIGTHEADWIVLQLRQKEWKRPLSFDLIKALLDVGQMQVKRTLVTKLHESVFYGTLEISKPDGELAEVDCRPSDAITLALRVAAPILVAAEIIDANATTLAELQQKSVEEIVSMLTNE